MRLDPHSRRSRILECLHTHGPLVSNREIASVSGCDRSLVRAVLSQARHGGLIVESMADGLRTIDLTEKGHAVVQEILSRRKANKRSRRSISKPASVHLGAAMTRKCLQCRGSFKSAWEGNRICQPCHELTSQQEASGLPAQFEGAAIA